MKKRIFLDLQFFRDLSSISQSLVLKKMTMTKQVVQPVTQQQVLDASQAQLLPQ